MTEPAPDTPLARATRDQALRRFAALIVASGAALVAGGAWWGGLDFAAGVLLGFLIVALNFYWTKKAVISVLFAGQPRTLLSLSLLLKFGVTGAVLFYAILRLRMDALGVLVGLSTLIVASALFALHLSLTRR